MSADGMSSTIILLFNTICAADKLPMVFAAHYFYNNRSINMYNNVHIILGKTE
ncbi:hypothetical protein T4B_2993, partial [Trichinella pseudospiralis]